ncbi:MAG: hypothetical protein WAP35_05435 [Solirubrobacterales bacterium]
MWIAPLIPACTLLSMVPTGLMALVDPGGDQRNHPDTFLGTLAVNLPGEVLFLVAFVMVITFAGVVAGRIVVGFRRRPAVSP